MKRLKCWWLVLIIFLFNSKYLYSTFWWTEDDKTDFDSGYVYRTTVTADGKIQLREWDDWWDNDWPLRIPIEIDNRLNSSQLKDYQISFTVDTSSLVANGKLDTSGSAIRIAGSDGKTLQNFWIESWNIVTSTGSTFWVRVSTIPANSISYIYLYIRNVSTNSLSNRDSVFDLYEDWETGQIRNQTAWSVNGWIVGGDKPFIIHTSTDILPNFLDNIIPALATGTVPVYEGKFDVTNSTIGHNQISTLSTQLNLSMQGMIEFYWAASCEGGASTQDHLRFFVGGIEQARIGSFPNFVWNYYYQTLPSGVVSLQWRYTKDGTDTRYFDRGWVDKIIVKKYTSIPPEVRVKQLESFSPYYTYGYFLSEVFDTEGQNCEFIYSSWNAIVPLNSSVYVYARSSNTIFSQTSDVVGFSNALTNDSDPSLLLSRGRYIQYKIEFNSDGSTTPYVDSVNFQFKPVPLRAENFYGQALSSTVISWNWTPKATYYIDGYRIYSSTRDYPTNWLLTTNPQEGLLAQLPSNTTFWIEQNLIPNTRYGRYVVAYTTTIYTFAGNASSNVLGQSAPYFRYTLSLEPDIVSERYVETEFFPYYSFIEISTQVWYTRISTQNFPSNNFSFTSKISTGAGSTEYYRYIFNTTTTWSDEQSSIWEPISYRYPNQAKGEEGIIERPIVFVQPLKNSASWYFMIRSYNGDDIFSGEKILGPYYFSGCPQNVTDIISETGKDIEGTVKLSWTAPTENMDSGNLTNATYIIKASAVGGVIDTEEKFNSIVSSSLATGMVSASITISTTVVAGTKCSYALTGLIPGATYWFAIKTRDIDDNISEISVSTSLFLARARASKVYRIEFITNPQTIFSGSISQKITVRTVDNEGDTIISRFGAECRLESTSLAGEFSTNGIDFGVNRVYILPNSSIGEFYYRSNTAGDYSITVSEISAIEKWSGTQNWFSATQNIKILPKKAVSFATIPQNGSYNSLIQVNKPIYIDAVDNVSNRYTGFEGVAIISSNISGVTVNYSSVTFTLSDSGRKEVVLQNAYFAGPSYLTISEVVNQDYKYLYFTDINNGNIVGSKGMIKTTDDSGNSWFTQYYQNLDYFGLNSIKVEDNITVAVGNNGLVIRSTDTFMSNTSTTLTTQNLNDIYFLNSSTIIICGNNGVIYKSTDTGLTYTLKPSGVTENLYSISLVNDTTGYFCGKNSTLLKTFDGGNTFEQLTVNGTDFYRIEFYDENIGYMVGADGKFFKTTNGGQSWSSTTVSAGKNFYGLNFISPTKGVICGENGLVYLTTNGGTSFSNISPVNETNTTFYTVKFVNATTIVVAGSKGVMYKTIDDGISWTKIVMSGTSQEYQWNGVIISTVQTNYAGSLKQGQSLNIANVAVRFRYNHSGMPTTKLNKFVIKKLGSLADSYISSVQIFLGSSLLGSGVFSSGEANITLSPEPTITFNPSTFTIRINLSSDAPLDETLALNFDFGCVQKSQGLEVARNNLPYITYKNPVFSEYFVVEPPSVDVYIIDADTKTYVWDGVINWSTSTIAKQGNIVQMLKFGLITNRSKSPFRKLRLNLIGTNVVDSDIKQVRLYYDSILPQMVVSSGTFSGGSVLLDIVSSLPGTNWQGKIANNTTSYFYVVAEISPESSFSSSLQEINFAIRSLVTTTYFLLDENNLNSIISQVSGISGVLQSNNVKIEISRDVVYIRPLPEIVSSLPVSIKQSQRSVVLPIGVSIDDGAALWTRLKIDNISNLADSYYRFGRSSATVVEVWRDVNGNGFLDDVDVSIGNGVFENKSSLVVFNQAERIGADFYKESLGQYATYFITCYIPQNATVGEKIQLKLSASTYFTLSGVDIVSGNNFPIISPEITIADFDDEVVVQITSMLDTETVLFETDVLVARIDLLSTCDATLQKLIISQEGNADNSTVKLIKIYLDNGDLRFNSSSDILVGTGTFSSLGRSEITFFNPSGALGYDPVLILDTGARLFITFDFNLNAVANKNIGIGLDSSDFYYNLPNRQKPFSYFSSGKTTVLDKRTPTKPQITPIIALSETIDTGRIISNPVYYTSKINEIKFSWSAEAPYGGGIKKGYVGLGTRKPTNINDTPDFKNFVSIDVSTNILGGLNLVSGKVYYLWLKAESNDGYVRINSVPIVVDKTSPEAPKTPEISLPSENVYWVNSQIELDNETFITSINLEERINTQLLWNKIKIINIDINNFISNFYLDNFNKSVIGTKIIISTRVAVNDTDFIEYTFVCSTTSIYTGEVINFYTLFLSNGYKIEDASVKLESKIENRQQKTLYFYRLATKNAAGLYSSFSNTSDMVYLSLPDEKISSLTSYPNPCDVRRSIVNIAYMLNQNMDVKIRIFDLAGNVVYENSFDAGNEGGKIGPNFVIWQESKTMFSGMYILLIEGRTASGEVVKKKWKIGIVK